MLKYSQDEIKRLADKIIKKANSASPFEIAKCLNINVLECELGNVLGYYKYYKRNKYVIINQNLDEAMKLIVCSHELGHAVLHTRLNTPYLTQFTLYSSSRIERDANVFAMNILLNYDMWSYFVFTDILKLPEILVTRI